MRTRTSSREKLRKEQEPRIVEIPPKMTRRFGTGKMLIPRPLDVDALIRRVKKGSLVTQLQIRERLANDFEVAVTCPITTGIFVRIVAEAAEEEMREGRKQVTPYWRVIKPDGSLNEKLPGGVERQAALLREEGHTIEPGEGRKLPKVVNFGRHLQEL